VSSPEPPTSRSLPSPPDRSDGIAVLFVIESLPSRLRTEMSNTFVVAWQRAWCTVTSVQPAPAVSVDAGLVSTRTPPLAPTVIWSSNPGSASYLSTPWERTTPGWQSP
jgi:hypothetical protein